MFDWIPLNVYATTHYYIMLFIVLFTFLQSQSQPIDSNSNFKFMNVVGGTYFVFLLFYIGLRPISGAFFIDMSTYNQYFIHYANGGEITTEKDVFFHLFTKFCSQIMSANAYFLLCAALYIIPLLVVCKKWFKNYWYYGFLFMVTAFSFWAYGTNGIRNGIAGSLFLLGMSRNNRISQIIWFLLALAFHKSMLLPLGAFILSNFYNNPKKVITFWGLCIPLSLVAGGFFESLFSSVGLGDDRLAYLTVGADASQFENTGFRWDFLAYSSTAVFAGWYYIVKRGYKDKKYFWLFNTYVISNAFWILVIRANFSNRFAYLSWFMIGLVIIYPLLKQFVIPKQYKKIGLILLFYFAFTFLMASIKTI